MLYRCIQFGRTALDIAEAKGDTQIIGILKTAIESEFEVEALVTNEGNIATKEGESEPSASGGDVEEKTKSGVFGKVRDWFQRNTKEIRLVNSTVPNTFYFQLQLCMYYLTTSYRTEQRYEAQ